MTKTCRRCGRQFYISPAHLTRGKAHFCSRECRNESMRGPGSPAWKGGEIDQVCEWCRQKFLARPDKIAQGKARFCSTQCRNQSRKRLVYKQCPYCGVEFIVSPSGEQRKFCSKACADNSRRTKTLKQCEWCGQEFDAYPSEIKNGRRFCSTGCQYEAGSGKNHPHWRGGPTEYPRAFNEKFRRMIRERDGYTCFICGAPDSKYVHHINYAKQDTWPENCVTLCRSCHARTNGNRKEWQRWFAKQMREPLFKL